MCVVVGRSSARSGRCVEQHDPTAGNIKSLWPFIGILAQFYTVSNVWIDSVDVASNGKHLLLTLKVLLRSLSPSLSLPLSDSLSRRGGIYCSESGLKNDYSSMLHERAKRSKWNCKINGRIELVLVGQKEKKLLLEHGRSSSVCICVFGLHLGKIILLYVR